MNRAILERPFDKELVKTRRGPHGELSYVPAVEYIKRLNEAFDGAWSWTVLNHEVQGSEVIVHGCLSAAGQVRHAFGGTAITVNRSTGEVISQADDIKAAATDALRKAASTFGVGLELYGSSTEAAPTPNPPLRSVPDPSAEPTQQRNRLTSRQLKMLYSVAHSAGFTDGDLKKMAIEKFGAAPEFLGRGDASSLISSLMSR